VKVESAIIAELGLFVYNTQTLHTAGVNMRTNIDLDDQLLDRAMLKARVDTKRAAVEAALRAYVETPDYAALLAAPAEDLIDNDYEPKPERPRVMAVHAPKVHYRG
jgi:Arc/MetJ family transcription regulator